jgi:hypothetical protein
MARVMRLIWRLDYPQSYSFMDRLGTVRRIVGETVPEYWTTISDGNILYSYVAIYQNSESGVSRDMSVETQSLNGQLRWGSGIDFVRVFQTDDFRNTEKIVRELLRVMDVKDMKRAGVRFLGMGTFADAKGGAFQRFSRLIANDVVTGVENAVDGNNDDLAIVLTGKTKDEISYRIQCGPSSRNDFITFFQQPSSEKEWENLKRYDFSFDIDLFEFNIYFVERNLFGWATTKLEKAIEVVSVFEKLAS